MNYREWWEEAHKLDIYERDEVAPFAWDAALEEAAKICDGLAAENEQSMRDEHDERFGVYAKKYRKAAAAIRALVKEGA